MFQFGEFHLVRGARLLLQRGLVVQLQPKAFDLLAYLVQHPQKMISKDELVENVWNGEAITDNNIAQHIFSLRKSLSQSPDDEGPLKTIYRRGVIFTEPVRVYQGASNLTALEILRNARHFYETFTEPGFRSTIELCARALQLQPDLASADALTALAYVRLADLFFEPALGAMPKAREAAMQALGKNQKCGEAHAALAGVHLYFDYDPRAALQSALAAIDTAPDLAYAHVTRTWSACLMADEPEISRALKDVRENVPAGLMRTIEGAVSYFQGDYHAAVSRLERLLGEDPNRQFVRYIRGASRLMLGELADAISDLEYVRSQEIVPLAAGYSDMHQRATAVLAIAYSRSKRPDRVEVMARDLQAAARHGYVSDLALAMCSAAQNNHPAVYKQLENAWKNRDPWLIFVRTERFLKDLELTPAFEKIALQIFAKFPYRRPYERHTS